MTRRLLKIMGYYQVIGGAIGIGLCINGFFKLYPSAPLVTFTLLAAVLLYAYSIYCGSCLLRFTNYRTSLKHSIANQFIQLLVFQTSSLVYKFVSGVAIFVGVNASPKLLVSIKATHSTFLFHVGDTGGDLFIGVNLVALGLILSFFLALHQSAPVGPPPARV